MDDLPSEVESRCYQLWFESRNDERNRGLDLLCAEYPAHERSIRALARELEQADDAIGQLRIEVDRPDPPAQFGPFEIVGELGVGGFGVVFRALQHEPVRRVVALKILQPGRLHERAIARFALERQALARMQHPAIAQVYDAGTGTDGRRFIAMELVVGAPITTHCDQHRLAVDARLRLFVEVCDGVTHAHQRGIVHRDIKPSNVLVVDRDGAAHPKIIDFGVAKALDEELGSDVELTIDGGFVGTPSYTSPEQAGGGPVDTRTDVHALGVMLHELLTGDLPYDRDRLQTSSLAKVLRIVREEEPQAPSRSLRGPSVAAAAAARSTSPRRLLQRVRGDLDRIVLHVLERDVDRRYGSVEALADDVRRHLDHLPVAAQRPSLRYAARKLARRHRVLVSITGVLLFAIVGVATAVSWSLLEVSAARDVAVAERERAAWNEYSAHLAAAQLALADGNAQLALRHLASTTRELQGWEHALLRAATDDAERILEPEHPIRDLYWVENGLLAAAPYRGGLQLWDVEHGQIVGEVPGQEGQTDAMVPIGDGRRVLVVRRGPGSVRDPETGAVHAAGRVELVDLVERRVLREVAAYRSDLTALAVSEDGVQFACHDLTQTLQRGRIDGAGEVERWDDVKLAVTALAFWPDGESLLLGTRYGQVARGIRPQTDRTVVRA